MGCMLQWSTRLASLVKLLAASERSSGFKTLEEQTAVAAVLSQVVSGFDLMAGADGMV